MISECQQGDEILDTFFFDATEDSETEMEYNTVIDTEKVNKKSEKNLPLKFQNAKKMMKFLIKFLIMRISLPLETRK